MNGITNTSSLSVNKSLAYEDPTSSRAGNNGIFKLDSSQADAARKIIEQKLITEMDRSQNGTIKPYMTPPTLHRTTADATSSTKNYYELMATLVVLLGEKAMDELKLRADMYLRFSQSMSSASKETLHQVETERQKYDEAKETLKNAQHALAESKQNLSTLQQKQAACEESLALLKQQHQLAVLNGAEQSTVEKLAASIEEKKQQINTTAQQIEKEIKIQAGYQQTITQAQGVLEKTASAMENSLNYLDNLNKKAAAAQDIIAKGENSTRTAALLMAQIIAIIGESSEETLRTNIEFSRKVQAAQQAKLRSDAEEVEAQQRKAQQMQETMGCIGKVLGAVITVVSCVAAVFTGGASLAIAAVGLAMMVGDEIYQKATGNESFISAALKPLMDSVFMPIIQAISNMISDLLIKLGLDPEKAQIVSTVMAIAIFVVVVILGAVLLKKLPVDKLMSAVGKMLGQALKGLTSAMKSAVSTIDDVITRMTQPLTRLLNQLMGSEVKMRQVANMLSLSSDVLEGVNAGVNTSGSVAVGAFEKKANDVLAEITLLLSASKIMQRFDKQITEAFAAIIEKTNQMLITSSDMANADLVTGRAILAQARV